MLADLTLRGKHRWSVGVRVGSYTGLRLCERLSTSQVRRCASADYSKSSVTVN